MYSSIKTSNVAGGLEKYYLELNKYFFNGELPSVVISFSKTKNPIKNIWISRGVEQFDINIPVTYLCCSIEEIISFLLHQMVHIYCFLHKIKDTSNNGLYHNKRFKEAAEAHGLFVEKAPKNYGWEITSPSENLIDFIEKEGWNNFQMSGGIIVNRIDCNIHKNNFSKNIIVPKFSNSRKYVCPKCGTIIRATRVVDVICGKCGKKFVQDNIIEEGKAMKSRKAKRT